MTKQEIIKEITERRDEYNKYIKSHPNPNIESHRYGWIRGMNEAIAIIENMEDK